MRRSQIFRGRGELGQGSVELLVALPLIALVVACGWQFLAAGHTWWKLNEVARLAARERYVARQRGEVNEGLRRGRELSAALLKSSPRSSRSLRHDSSGAVVVTARIPLVPVFRQALGDDAGPKLTARSRVAP